MSRQTIAIGIDPGLEGAVVAVDHDLQVVGFFDTPVIDMGKGKRTRREHAVADMRRELLGVVDQRPGVLVVCWLEASHAMPGQGVRSMFIAGYGAGLWRGLLAGLGLRYEVVHAKTWGKTMLRDLPAGDTVYGQRQMAGR